MWLHLRWSKAEGSRLLEMGPTHPSSAGVSEWTLSACQQRFSEHFVTFDPVTLEFVLYILLDIQRKGRTACLYIGEVSPQWETCRSQLNRGLRVAWQQVTEFGIQ